MMLEAKVFTVDITLPKNGCAKVLLITCSDPNYREAFTGFLDEVKKWEEDDSAIHIMIPGGIKDFINENGTGKITSYLQLHHNSHRFEKVYLVAHGSCGKYRIDDNVTFDDSDAETLFHGNELLHAENKVKQLFPNVEVAKFFARKISQVSLNPMNPEGEVSTTISFKIIR